MFKTKEEAATHYGVDINDPEQVEDFLEFCEGCKQWGSPSIHCADELEGIQPNDGHYHGDYDEPATLDGVFYERLCCDCRAKAESGQIAKEEAQQNKEEETPSPSLPEEATTRLGWWTIKMEMFGDGNTEISECTLEHIAKLITEGYTQGEIIEHDEEVTV